MWTNTVFWYLSFCITLKIYVSKIYFFIFYYYSSIFSLLCVALWDILVIRPAEERVHLSAELDIKTFTVSKTDRVSVALVNLSLWVRRYQTRQSESVWWRISQHASQRTKTTQECKGSWEGQADTLLQQDVAEKRTLSVRPLVPVSPPGLSRRTGQTDWWEMPGGSIPWPTLTTPALFNIMNIFWARPPSSSDTALFSSSVSLSVFVSLLSSAFHLLHSTKKVTEIRNNAIFLFYWSYMYKYVMYPWMGYCFTIQRHKMTTKRHETATERHKMIDINGQQRDAKQPQDTKPLRRQHSSMPK